MLNYLFCIFIAHDIRFNIKLIEIVEKKNGDRFKMTSLGLNERKKIRTQSDGLSFKIVRRSLNRSNL